MHLSGAARVADVVQIAMAGMVVPIAIGDLFGWWRRENEDSARPSLIGLLVASGAVLTANAVVMRSTGRVLETALFLRAVGLSALAIAVVVVASHIGGRHTPRVLGVLVVGLAGARVALWVGTDVLYAHRLDHGFPQYGPWLPALNGVLLILAFGYLALVGGKGGDPVERVGVLLGVGGTAIVAATSLVVPSRAWAELLSGYLVVPVLVALYVTVAARLTHLRRIERLFSERQASIAALWRDAPCTPFAPAKRSRRPSPSPTC